MDSIIKWGFIGCGEATEKKSGPAFAAVKGSEVIAVMGRDKEKTRNYAKRHNIPHSYTDAQALIDDPEVNAVYIATPPSSHATYAIMAMKAGKPVYVEKPLAASYEDCARINRISRETGVPCFVAYYRLHQRYALHFYFDSLRKDYWPSAPDADVWFPFLQLQNKHHPSLLASSGKEGLQQHQVPPPK